MKGDYFEPEVYGLKELITAYKQTINTVKFHGPTIFSEIIDTAIKYCQAAIDDGNLL